MVKKTIAKIMTLAVLAGMLTCSSVHAAGPIEVYNDSGEVTVNVPNLTSAEETTLLVVKGDKTIAQAFADTTLVHHIDQTAADDEGTATFNFSVTDTSGTYSIYSGYATMSESDEALEDVLDESTPPSPGDSYMLGDVNGDATINVTDVAAIIQHVVNDSPFQKNVDGVMVDYAEGAQAADVNKSGDINVTDVSKIIGYIVNDEPFEQ